MRHVTLHITLTIIVCSMVSSLMAADTLIYNNSTYAGYTFTPQYYDGVFDFGTSTGGLVKKFSFGYRNLSYTTSWARITFYSYPDTYNYEPGYYLKTININNIPPSTSPYSVYDYVLPENDRFTLPNGSFGFSILFSDSSTNLVLASGGMGNQNELWEYYDDWLYGWGWYPFWFNGTPWAGLYMKIWTGPPIDQITCDIYGYKFNDTNSNGVRDVGEAILPGWDFYLDIDNDGVYDTTEPNVRSDPNGRYFFENKDSPATYRVREIIKSGWTQTLPGSAGSYQHVVATEPNHVYGPYNFGNVFQTNNASISGSVFYDSNGNSARDAGESGQANWRVYIDTNGNDHYNSGEPTALTNASGNYQITGLATGVYRVAEETQAGWVQTYPTAACTHTVTISTSGQAVSSINFGNHTFSTYGGGSGTLASPYLIYNHLHLQAIGTHKADWGKYFKLMANIDLSKYSGDQFNLIGRYNFADQTTPFSGVFDGNGYTISNFTYTYTQSPQECIGLFGYLWYGKVKNLRLQNVNINTQGGGVESGALAGWLRDNSTISNCHVAQGNVTANNSGAAGLIGSIGVSTVTDCSVTGLNVTCTSSRAGGIACENGGAIYRCSFEGTVYGQEDVGGFVGSSNGTISRCYANASVNGFQHVGGMAGENTDDGVISQCYSQGSVQTHTDPLYGLAGNEAGGFVGRNSSGDILNSFSMATVSSVQKVGGLVGISWADTGSSNYITNCYAVGAVSGTSSVGGLIGWNIDSLTVITGCFWNKQTTGRTTSNGGTGLLTVDMQTKQTYLTAGWNFDNIWRMCMDGVHYPKFQWQSSTADFVCPDGVDQLDLEVFVDQWLLHTNLAANIVKDDMVDLLDWQKLAAAWMTSTGQPNWNSACDIAPTGGDSHVDQQDLMVLVKQWLEYEAWNADIAPAGGDGFVNLLDFEVFASYWLLGQ